MTLVYHDEVVVAPVQTRQVNSIRHTSFAAQVCMEQHIIAQTVFFQWVVFIVAFIGIPVLIEFLGAEHQHTLVAILVILDDRDGRKGLSQTYTIGQDTAIIGLQLVDDGQSRIALEVIEFVPNLRTLEACRLVG